eukprot:EG_transcript_19465
MAVGGVIVWKFEELNRLLRAFLVWVDQHPTEGCGLYLLLYCAATITLFPCSLITIAAGYAFHWAALPLTLAGASAGMATAFLIARYFARERVQGWAESNRKFLLVDQMVSTEGWKIVFMLRLAPIIPYNVLNYVVGLTSISFRESMMASILGVLPGMSMFVYFGVIAGSLDDVFAGHSGPGQVTKMALFGVSAVMLVLLLAFVTMRVRQDLLQAERHLGLESGSASE